MKSKKKKGYTGLYFYIIIVIIMFRRSFIVGSLVLLSVGFSFADFQSDVKKCSESNNYWLGTTPSEINSCREKVRNKYIVKKTTACKMKDGLYQLPLEAKRPSKNLFNNEFYKFNNIVYYPIRVYTANQENYEHYLYSYNCKTKKTLSWLSDNNLLIDIVQWYKEKIFIRQVLLNTDARSLENILDVKTSTIRELSLSSMKWYDAYYKLLKTKIVDIFNTTNSIYMTEDDESRLSKKWWWLLKYFDIDWYIKCPYIMCYPWLSVDNINTSLVGNIIFRAELSNPSQSIALKLAKVDLYNNTIMLNK